MRTVLLLTILSGCGYPDSPTDKQVIPDTGDTDPGTPDADGDGYDAAVDCDDTNPDVNPGAAEVCDAAHTDEDCDGAADDDDPDVTGTTTWSVDTDGDGYGDAAAASVSCEGTGIADASDCDDADSTIHPGAAEVCDGDDEDCDGLVDDDDPDVTGTTSVYADADADGFGDPGAIVTACAPVGVLNAWDCDDGDAAVNPRATEVCDAADTDEDCDGLADEADPTVTGMSAWYPDADGDGYGDSSAVATVACEGAGVADGTDCDDADIDVNPGVAEVCDGVADEDCDGLVDDADPDVTGTSTWYADVDGDGYGDASVATTACAGDVTDANDCDDRDAAVNPAGTEVCDFYVTDEDCDGLADEADPDISAIPAWYTDGDEDGYGDASAPAASCYAGVADSTDCDDGDDAVNPGAAEECDAADVDEDCDGLADDDDPDVAGLTRYADADGDGYGDPSLGTIGCDGGVAEGTDCDDADATISPAAAEVCDGGTTDEDCDGVADETGPVAVWGGWPTPDTAGGVGAYADFLHDIDGDGDLDYLGCRSRLYVALNDGSPWVVEDSFEISYTSTTLSTTCTELDVADVDDDGDDDVLVLLNTSLYWLENTAGAMGSAQLLQSGLTSSAVYVDTGDFDGDGLTDIVAPPYLLWNDGGGAFTVDYTPGGGWFPSAVELLPDGRRMLADNFQDWVADSARTWSTVSVDANCDGYYITQSNARSADFNGDGYLDTIAEGVDICYGDGTGALTWGGELYAVDRSSWTTWVSYIADADGDGLADLVMNDHVNEGPDLRLFVGDGSGFTEAEQMWLPYDMHQEGGAVWEDLDGDGTAELLAWDGHSDDWSWYTPGASGFAAAAVHDFVGSSNAEGDVVPADFDGDGAVDLLYLQDGVARVGTYDGARGFTWSSDLAITASWYTAYYGKVGADVDGDGDEEVVTTYPTVDLYEWDGSALTTTTLSLTGYHDADTVWTPDLDGDGDAELVFENLGLERRYLYESEYVYYGGLWEGYPSSFTDLLATVGTNVALAVVADADVTGDGADDLVYVDATGVRVWGWDGSALAETASTDVDWAATATDLSSRRGVGTGDVDGDGDIDLWLALPDEAAVQQMLNDGTGTFTLGDRVTAPSDMVDSQVLRFGTLVGEAPNAWTVGTDGETESFRFVDGAYEEVGLALPLFDDYAKIRDVDGDGIPDLMGGIEDRAFVYWGTAEDVSACD